MEGVREVVRNLLTKQTLSPEERDILYPPSEPPKKKRSPRRPPNRGRVGKPQKEYEIINLPEEEPDDRDGYEIINPRPKKQPSGVQEEDFYYRAPPPPQPARRLTGSVIVALILLALLSGILIYFAAITR